MTLASTDFTNRLSQLCEEYRQNNGFTHEDYTTYNVKRGLRNPDGTGVMAGLTRICNVHGFLVDDGVKIPDEESSHIVGQMLMILQMPAQQKTDLAMRKQPGF